MARVIMAGWKVGLRKVSLSLLQRDMLGLPLPIAKRNVDNLLDGEVVEIDVADAATAGRFAEAATAIGAVCLLRDEP